jgi:photosystem II stability/assembly factor-like uncharacterized protein
MKNLYILALLSLMLYANQSKAQWKNLNAPKSNNEDYQLLAVSDNGKNFAACTGKFDLATFKTTLTYTTSHDYGATWQVYPTNQIQGGQSMFWDGDVLYVQTSNATIADLKKSSDFGATFTVQNSSYNTQTPIVRSANGKWFLENSSILNYSTDKGANWIKKELGSGQYFIDYVFANNGNMVATVNGGVAYSKDGGETWTYSNFASNTLKTSYNSISKASDGTLIVFKQDTPTPLISKSTDNGVSWQALNLSLPANTKKLLYCGTDLVAYTVLGATYVSSNAGLTFPAMAPTSPLTTVTDMIATNSNVYIFGLSAIYKYGNPTTGITDLFPDNRISVFPNPFTDKLHLGSEKKFRKYSIADITGKTTCLGTITGNEVDLSFLKSGLYFLSLDDVQGNRSTIKIVKQ